MEERAAAPASPATKPTHAPAMDVVAPHGPAPVAVEPEPATKDADEKDKQALTEALKDAKKDKPKKPAAAKEPSNGVGMAIFATMVIVLGLAAMATYAYLKTQ
jgi:hypothetical protein